MLTQKAVHLMIVAVKQMLLATFCTVITLPINFLFVKFVETQKDSFFSLLSIGYLGVTRVMESYNERKLKIFLKLVLKSLAI